MSNQITIHDVAKTAGVSVTTVSRVLNNKDDVAKATFEKVSKVIDDLGYATNLAARSMRSRRTNVIGLIVSNIEQIFAIEVMKGVNRTIGKHGYDLIIYTNNKIQGKSTAAKERNYVALLNNSIADGVIILTPVTTTFPTDAPVVAVDPNLQSPDCPAVIATNYEGAHEAVSYLIELGHRRIGFVGGRLDLQSATQRQQGYVDACQEANIEIDDSLITIGDYSTDAGYECGKQLLSQPERPTAIFAANDQSAFGVIKAAHELGLQIPQDLSLIGFDNVPESAYYLPDGLTTIDQHMLQIGEAATNMIFDLINEKPLDGMVHQVPTRLVKRGSCQAI